MINKNIKAWVARDFVIAMLIFSGCIALYVIMIGSIANDYDNPNVVSPEFSAKFDKFSDNTDVAAKMYSAVNNESGLSLIGTADLIFTSTFEVISLVFISLDVAKDQMTGFGTFFGIPTPITSIFLVLVFSILTVSIIFIILTSIRSGGKL